MTIDGLSNLSIPSLEWPKRQRRRGRRTNIERVPEHTHDCIPSIRSDIGALQMSRKKKGEKGIGKDIQADIAGTERTN